jgi:hypothetical protein
MTNDNNQGVGSPQTFGEKAVGLSFNPSNDDKVGNIKKSCAAVIDVLNDERNAIKSSKDEDDGQNGERIAMLTIAIRAIQDGQMWGVKAVTWK